MIHKGIIIFSKFSSAIIKSKVLIALFLSDYKNPFTDIYSHSIEGYFT